jgi:anti-sigma factor RsiW
MNMNHESFRELIALQLYSELDANERARLEQHLKTCSDCRAFARELSSGLGAMRNLPVNETAGEIPADWRERLRRSTIEEPKRARISPMWSSVAAFAAGILLATVLMHRASGNPIELVASNDGAHVPSIYERFNGSTPPPQATTGGQLARLSEYLKR